MQGFDLGCDRLHPSKPRSPIITDYTCVGQYLLQDPVLLTNVRAFPMRRDTELRYRGPPRQFMIPLTFHVSLLKTRRPSYQLFFCVLRWRSAGSCRTSRSCCPSLRFRCTWRVISVTCIACLKCPPGWHYLVGGNAGSDLVCLHCSVHLRS